MNFSSDAMADFEGLLEVNRKICKQQMAENSFAYAAYELCGIAFIRLKLNIVHEGESCENGEPSPPPPPLAAHCLPLAVKDKNQLKKRRMTYAGSC